METMGYRVTIERWMGHWVVTIQARVGGDGAADEWVSLLALQYGAYEFATMESELASILDHVRRHLLA